MGSNPYIDQADEVARHQDVNPGDRANALATLAVAQQLMLSLGGLDSRLRKLEKAIEDTNKNLKHVRVEIGRKR